MAPREIGLLPSIVPLIPTLFFPAVAFWSVAGSTKDSTANWIALEATVYFQKPFAHSIYTLVLRHT